MYKGQILGATAEKTQTPVTFILVFGKPKAADNSTMRKRDRLGKTDLHGKV